ncbi:RidA family protein [Cupriavidus gilardii]|uniref:RidA family protein n=1 Tax=Cupriavidus gilardii TaxID=82541 RepID=UPI001EE539F7|nr:RidA family protein [Cupriavidus gilardii]MCG5258834.1 RidA family protein [Cupriavidus gilardii]MDF9429348.1 RidA family protein [Cupriavidus gilardii]
MTNRHQGSRNPAGKGVAYPEVPTLALPRGHYSHVATGLGLVYVSGQLPLNPHGEPRADLPLAEQAALALRNVEAALAAGGCGWHDVLKVTVYLAGVEHWPAFDAVYRQLLGGARPARAVVPVPALHYGVLVEVEAVAVHPDAVAAGAS